MSLEREKTKIEMVHWCKIWQKVRKYEVRKYETYSLCLPIFCKFSPTLFAYIKYISSKGIDYSNPTIAEGYVRQLFPQLPRHPR